MDIRIANEMRTELSMCPRVSMGIAPVNNNVAIAIHAKKIPGVFTWLNIPQDRILQKINKAYYK